MLRAYSVAGVLSGSVATQDEVENYTRVQKLGVSR